MANDIFILLNPPNDITIHNLYMTDIKKQN